MEITKQDWINAKIQNENLIKGNSIQITMAEKVIELCNEKIKEFPEDKIPDNNNNPIIA